MLEAQLFFGVPSEAGFQRFLDTDVTPRFPDGLTAIDAQGRWRAPDGRLTEERSKLVVIVAPAGAATAARLEAVRDAYKMQFSQQSVGMVTRPVCTDF